MTDLQIQLIQLAWEQAQPQTDSLAETFYEHLFSQSPGLRHLFPKRFDYQLNKFGNTLSHIVHSLRRLDVLLPQIQLLGARHAHYAVESGHYELVKHSMIYALSTHLEDHWSPGMAEAWEAAYQLMADVMIEAQASVQDSGMRPAV
mgnify:CR=1 FL=1